MKSINIACINVYPLFDHTIAWRIGGMETRVALLARGLSGSGHWQVRVITNDFGQRWRERKEGIEFDIYQHVHLRASNDVNTRFFQSGRFPRLYLDRRDLHLLWQIPVLFLFRMLPGFFFPIFWHRRQANVTCCFGINGNSAQIIADCHRSGMRTVLCIASDDDLSPEYRPGDQRRNDYRTPHWMAHYALIHADHIFVQTESQQRALESRFGRRGELIRNPVDISADDPARWPARHERDIVLWIGRSDTYHKRPLLLLELAKHCPDLPFLMILNKTHADVFETVLAQKTPNVTVIELVPHHEIWAYYRRARVFVSTSAYEGFPNTFLQCAVAGVPVASVAVDPENTLSRHGCGLLANGSLDALEQHVRALWSDAELAEGQALTFHRYALAHHGLDSQVKRFDALLEQVIDKPVSPSTRPWWSKPWRRFLSRFGN